MWVNVRRREQGGRWELLVGEFSLQLPKEWGETEKSQRVLMLLSIVILDNPMEKGMQPNPVFLSGEFHGLGSLVGYSPWGHRVRHD